MQLNIHASGSNVAILLFLCTIVQGFKTERRTLNHASTFCSLLQPGTKRHQEGHNAQDEARRMVMNECKEVRSADSQDESTFTSAAGRNHTYIDIKFASLTAFADHAAIH
jgi:hypothetical protein